VRTPLLDVLGAAIDRNEKCTTYKRVPGRRKPVQSMHFNSMATQRQFIAHRVGCDEAQVPHDPRQGAVPGDYVPPWRRKKFPPVVLTTGPEEILCSGRVGSWAPIRGPLPLLGPAAGSVGSLRRMSQRRVFRRETEADFAVSAVE
jgi:hypothetical protein